MSEKSVLRDGARGGSLTILGQVAKIILQFVSVIVLSRLLTPDTFGLVAMATVLYAFGDLIRDFGLTTASLQAPRLEAGQASNMFWISAAAGLGTALALALAAPAAAVFYDDPRVELIAQALALGLAMNGLHTQLQVGLARAHRFGLLAATDVLAQFSGLAVAILAALAGQGVWALVLQILVTSGVLLGSRWLALRWLPSRPRRNQGTWQLVRSSIDFGAAQLLNYAAANTDTLVIGNRWGASELGYYNRAFQLLSMPINAMLGPLTNVVVPVANKARAQGTPVDSVLLRMQFLVAGTIVWVFVTATATAPDLIPLVLGVEWSGSVVLFQILALGGMVQAFSYVSYWGFVLHGLSRSLLMYNLVSKALAVGLVLAGSMYGVAGVAWGYTIGLWLSWPINLVWLAKKGGQDGWAFLRGGVTVLCAGGVALAAGLAVLHYAAEWPVVARILVVVVSMAGAYLLFLTAVPSARRELTKAAGLVPELLRRG